MWSLPTFIDTLCGRKKGFETQACRRSGRRRGRLFAPHGGGREAGTFARVQALRGELVQPVISARAGRVVKLMGDGLLAEFPSVVEAVQCAVEIQKAVGGHEPEMPEDQRLSLRIGVNLGDVIFDSDDIYGRRRQHCGTLGSRG